jgi:phenylalanyl-tRNA synthetase beta chain
MDGDYRDARGVAENVLEDLGIESSVEHCSAEALDVSARAQILVQGRRIGYLGHPARNLLKEAGLKVRPVYGELDLAALQDLARQVKKFTELPRFPPVVRDLALIVEELVPYGSVESAIRGLSLEHLESHALFEVYRGPQIGEGRKSLNIRLVFRSSEGTLTSETVDRQMTRLGDRLRQDLGAQVRGVAAE